MPIKQRPKSLQDIWATFAIKFITDAFQTIAKSGHTGKWRSDRSCKMLIHDLRKLDYFLKLIFVYTFQLMVILSRLYDCKIQLQDHTKGIFLVTMKLAL